MVLTKNDSHVQDALGNRIEQFKDKDNFAAYLTSFTTQVQAVEDALFQVLDETDLLTSLGQQLDDLGKIVGEARNGRDDDSYRLAIQARIKLNLSNGTIEDVIGLIRALVGDKTVIITEEPDATFTAEVVEDIDVDGAVVANFVKSGRPAGVKGLFLWHTVGPEFHFDTGPGFDVGELGGAEEA